MTSRPSADSVYTKQKDSHLQSCIQAQWMYYKKAKQVSAFRFVCAVVLLCAASVLSAQFQTKIVIESCVIVTVLILFADIIFEMWKTKYQQIAADIQQYVDISLFATQKYRDDWGDILTHQQAVELCYKVVKKRHNEFKQWYADYSKFHHYKEVIYCQAENVRWNRNLSKSFLRLLCSVSALLFVALIVIETLVFQASLANTLRTVIWFSPLIQYLIRVIMEMHRTDKQKQLIQARIDSVIQNENEWDDWGWEKREIEIQRQIYSLRKSSVLIPEWYYKMTAKKYNNLEKNIAKEMKKNDKRN